MTKQATHTFTIGEHATIQQISRNGRLFEAFTHHTTYNGKKAKLLAIHGRDKSTEHMYKDAHPGDVYVSLDMGDSVIRSVIPCDVTFELS
jgi:hypothetical protein